ncbi:MAG: universal stress protein [Gemmatimonadota bacterium]
MTGSPREPLRAEQIAAAPAWEEGRLRLLVCVGGGRESEETLGFAIRIVKALGGDLTILFVSEAVPPSVRDEVRLSREKLTQWETDIPGVTALRHARDVLREEGLLRVEADGRPRVRHPLRASAVGVFEVELQGTYGESVHLRMREGEIAEEIRRETRAHPCDLLIIGAGTNRRLQHKLAQFNEVSTLFVKNVRPQRYRFLVCTGGEPAGVTLAAFTARVAKALRIGVTVLSVDDLRQARGAAERWVERISEVFEARGVEVRGVVRKGKLVRTIVETAGEDHVIVIGRSHEPEIKKLFFGSRPIRVIQNARCPVLHVV